MAEPILSCDGVGVSFGAFRAVTDVSLGFSAGVKYGLIGPNGAGKTTLVNVLSGALVPSTGTVTYKGRLISREPRHSPHRKGISRGFQTASLFPEYSALDNLLIGVQAASGRQAIHRLAHRDKTVMARALEMLELIGLSAADKPAGLLSHGDQRALEMGLTCIPDPEVLLLDEPLAGVGLGALERTISLVKRFAAGRTVIMIEHNMDALLSIVDTIVVMTGGQVIATGSKEEIRGNVAVREAYLGAKS